MMLKIIVVILFFITVGCSKPIGIDVPQIPQQMAVFSKSNVNEPFVISVTNTFKNTNDVFNPTFLDSLYPEGLIVLLNNSKEIDTLFQEPQLTYISSKIVMEPGELYNLQVIDTIKNRIAIATAIGLAQPIGNVLVKVNRSITDTIIQVKVSIADDATLKNFYAVRISSGEEVSSGFNTLNESVFIVTDNSNTSNFLEKDYILTKENFNITSFSDSLIVHVDHISENYFNFLNANDTRNKINDQIILLPNQFETNVSGGQGVFSANATQSYLFDLKKN